MKDKSINKKGSWNRMSTIFSKPLTNDGCHFSEHLLCSKSWNQHSDSLFLPGLLSLFWGIHYVLFFLITTIREVLLFLFHGWKT